MSGIFGVLHKDGQQASYNDLALMSESLIHRGPDGQGCWCNGSIGLGHRMLRTTPESLNENQPLINKEARLTITADARIDNRDELISRIGLDSSRAKQYTDARLILEAYIKWQNSCVDFLLGDFAFVIWDERKKKLFCARDHFGVKPFYYCETDRFFGFASEIKGLLCLPTVPSEIYEPRIADYLVDSLEGINKTCTFYKAILKLPAANTLVIEQSKSTHYCYWSPKPENPIIFSTDVEYTEAFTELFTEAVRCRLRSLKPPATMLSGGMDSSAIAAVSREILAQENQKIHTFSAVLNAEQAITCEETAAIKAVIDQGGLSATTFSINHFEQVRNQLEYARSKQDDPFDTWMIIPQLMYLSANQKGCNVLLSGIPGDEVVSILGIRHIRHLISHGQWLNVFKESIGLYNKQGYRLFSDIFRPCLLQTLIPGWAKKSIQQYRFSRRMLAIEKNAMLNAEFAKKINLLRRIQELDVHTTESRDLRKQNTEVLVHPYISVALERYDHAASLWAVEPRHPFLDRRLVEFCLNLPWDQKVRQGWNKWILRQSMVNYLPESVVWRKTNRNTHLAHYFNQAMLAPLDQFIESYLDDQLGTLAAYVDVQAVRLSWKNKAMGSREKTWSVIALGLWLNRCYNFKK